MRRPVAGEADMGSIRRFQTPHGQRWRGWAHGWAQKKSAAWRRAFKWPDRYGERSAGGGNCLNGTLCVLPDKDNWDFL